MSTPEPHPYRKLNYPINNLEQSFTQEQKLQTRSNIGIPSSEDEEGKVLMVDNAAGELVWAEAPNGLPDIASGDEGKFLSVENGEPAWTDVDIPEQVNADWDATSGVQEILNKPQMKPLVAGSNITITEGTSQFTISSTSDPQVNADWDATSGVQEILNKPNLSTVATTGQYADLLGKPDIPASTSELVNDSNFITASEAPVQDVKVDGSSVVDGNGVANITIPQFQQLNSDWDATSGVQEILNRPEVKPLVAGSNITITETPSSVEIAGVSSSQLNADWDATSGVQEILNKPNLSTVALTGQYADLLGKPDIPASTSELVNDSGFVTSSEIPAQINADWDSASGASEILNKPDLSIYAEKSDLATVATTGSFNDLVDKPTIPSAQVNADWDATSGVSEILNRPNLATVATTGDYSDLQNLPSIPAAQVNSDWSATSGVQEILNKPTVKQVVAGSNITITETASTFEISSTGGGGGSQVNSDWDATSGVAEILNKPDLSVYATTSAMTSALADKQDTLTAGTNVSISNNVISATDTTYTAGTGIDITDDVISVETPVDIVAGPGITIDNPDGNTLRVSMASNEEVVLWSDAAGAFAATLNESLFNFEKIKVFQLTETSYHIQEFYTSDLTSNAFTIGATYQAASNQIYCFSSKWSITNSGVNIESTGKGYGLVGTTNGFTFYPNNVYNGKICRVVGIHRIANN